MTRVKAIGRVKTIGNEQIMRCVKEPIEGVIYPSNEDVTSYERLGLFSGETMDGAFRRLAQKFPGRIALGEGEKNITYHELDMRTDHIAAGLLACGLKPLDRAVFQLVNCTELVVMFLACLKAGIIPICTLAAHRSAEIGFLSKHARAKAHIIHADAKKFDFLNFSRDMRAQVPSLQLTIAATGEPPEENERIITLARIESLGKEGRNQEKLAQVEKDARQVAVFQLSGGTSGTPKIIPRFHNEYLYQITATARFQELTEQDIAFSPAPMMHNAPIVCYWGCVLWSGGKVVCCPEMSAEAIAKTIAQHRPNWMAIPLPLVVNMERAGLLDKAHFADVRITAPGNVRRIKELTGARAIPLYGMTEGIICYGRHRDPEPVLARMVGRAVSEHDMYRIVDPETAQVLADGEIGEFCFKGPSSCRGYFDAVERNRDAFTHDGFVKSGDLMCVHLVDGVRYLSFEGRVKDVVSRGGEKINCQEVERALSTHPDIGAIAIVPMSDPDYGEKACAFIIPAAGRVVPTIADIAVHLEKVGMAKFKWPERIEALSAFPQTSSGKMSKPKLREKIEALLKEERSLST